MSMAAYMSPITSVDSASLVVFDKMLQTDGDRDSMFL
jgi:hypothetical protein